MADLAFDLDDPLNDYQAEQFEAVLAGKPVVATRGAWGCGKSDGIAFILWYMAKTWPGSEWLWVTDTAKRRKRVVIPACKRWFKGARHEISNQRWVFKNGSIVWMAEWFTSSTKSDDQNPIEGFNGSGAAIDEAQVFPNSQLAKRLRGRCRVPLRRGDRTQRNFMLITGLPVPDAWWLRYAEKAGGECLYPVSGVNAKNLSPDWVDQARVELDPDEFEALINNKPAPLKGAVYDQWRGEEWPAGNLISGWKPNVREPVRIWQDFGRWPASVLVQSLDIVHPETDEVETVDVMFAEVAPNDVDLSAVVRGVLAKAWPAQYRAANPDWRGPWLESGCGDPAGTHRDTRGLDDITELAKSPADGGIGVSIRYTNDVAKKHVPNGIRRVKRRILGNDGVRRLLCTREMWDAGLAAPEKHRTFARAIQRYRYRDNGDPEPVKDGYSDHHMDAIRYGHTNEHWWDSMMDDRMPGVDIHADIPKRAWRG